MEKIRDITFLHLGKDKCPRCGVFGSKKSEEGIHFYECPRCGTEFTNEFIISDGEIEEELFDNT